MQSKPNNKKGLKMYMTLHDNDKLLCEVDISCEKSVGKKEKWFVRLSTYFKIGNYTEFLRGVSYLDGIELGNDFAHIQDFALELNEHTGEYPELKLYDTNDKGLKEDKTEIIKITRERLQKLATKWGLEYNED